MRRCEINLHGIFTKWIRLRLLFALPHWVKGTWSVKHISKMTKCRSRYNTVLSGMSRNHCRSAWRVLGVAVVACSGLVGVAFAEEEASGVLRLADAVKVERRVVKQSAGFRSVGLSGDAARAFFNLQLIDGDVVLPASLEWALPHHRFMWDDLVAMAKRPEGPARLVEAQIQRVMRDFREGITHYGEANHRIGSVEVTLRALTTRGLAAFETGQPGVRVGVGPGPYRVGEDIRVYYFEKYFSGKMRNPHPAPALPAGLRRVNPAAWRELEIPLDRKVWRSWAGIDESPLGRVASGQLILLADVPGRYRLGPAALGLDPEEVDDDDGFAEVVFDVMQDGEGGAAALQEEAVAVAGGKPLRWSTPWQGRLHAGDAAVGNRSALDHEPVAGSLHIGPSLEQQADLLHASEQGARLILRVEYRPGRSAETFGEVSVFGEQVRFEITDVSRRIPATRIASHDVQWHLEDHAPHSERVSLHVWQRCEMPGVDPLPDDWNKAFEVGERRMRDVPMFEGLGLVAPSAIKSAWRGDDGAVYVHLVHQLRRPPAVPTRVNLDLLTVPLPGVSYGWGVIEIPGQMANAVQ